MRIAYVGYQTTVIDGYQTYLPEPRAPSNYKDQQKIAEYVEQVRHKQIADAHFKPMTASIRMTHIIENSNTPVIPARNEPLAVTLTPYNVIIALGMTDLLRLMRVQLIDTLGVIPAEQRWLAIPELDSRFKPLLIDPISRILGSEAAENSDPYLVAKRFLKINESDFSRLYTGVVGNAKLAYNLGNLLGLS